MRKPTQSKIQNEATVLRRLREAAGLTTRQAGGLAGVAHTTISQFENGKRSFTAFRIEQLVKAYGYTMEEYHKILGRKAVINLKDDCATMLDLLDDEQMGAVRSVMAQMLRHPQESSGATSPGETSQSNSKN